MDNIHLAEFIFITFTSLIDSGQYSSAHTEPLYVFIISIFLQYCQNQFQFAMEIILELSCIFNSSITHYIHLSQVNKVTRWVALMIQLEQQQHGEFVGGWGG